MSMEKLVLDFVERIKTLSKYIGRLEYERDNLETKLGAERNEARNLKWQLQDAKNEIEALSRRNESLSQKLTTLRTNLSVNGLASNGQPLEEFVDAHIQAHELIKAIKEVRATSGLGLKEAKDYVDTRAIKIGARDSGGNWLIPITPLPPVKMDSRDLG